MKLVFTEKQHSQLLWMFGVMVLSVSLSSNLNAQFETKWLSVGNLQSWYSNVGCEIEEGRIKVQQDGLRWPAIYSYQDMEAAKGLWIGAKNFKDATGKICTSKVVHVGPRVTGAGEFFPTKFEMISRFDPPVVFVDGSQSIGQTVENNSVDPTLKPDRMIINVVNTAVGITMTRKIMAFSHPLHDNYFIYDYTFTNTGNVNDNATIELPNQTLEGVYFFWQSRYSVCWDTRYVIGNATGWGINAMLDSRGDTTGTVANTFFPGNKDNDLRCWYVWHGKYPPFTLYDNVGGPIWIGYYDKTDTVGRLGAAQFVGNVTLYADKSATDKTDDPAQPRTTIYESSDDPLTSQNDQFNDTKMTAEYGWMSMGHMFPRHCDKVGPTGDPALGTPGGFSCCSGYGPYTLKPGESIHIVMAEGAAGLSREACISIGKKFKLGQISAAAKNDSVYAGRDSLIQTFRRAAANFRSGYGITQALPPKVFNVNSGGDRISLSWEPYPDGETSGGFKGYRVYRAIGRVDSTYHEIFACGSGINGTPVVRSFDDKTAVRGVSYYYYVVSEGDQVSSRYYAQTYDPAYLRRAPGTSMDAIRVVPNPYVISSDANMLRYPQEPDKIGFLNIPGECMIKIYTESGELIKTIEHTNGSGDEYWNSVTSSNQVVVSGVYIAVITTPSGDKVIKKFVIIR
jgi:hypothetical protein